MWFYLNNYKGLLSGTFCASVTGTPSWLQPNMSSTFGPVTGDLLALDCQHPRCA